MFGACGKIRLDHHAAGEVDAQIQAAHGDEREGCRNDQTADNPYHTLRVFMNGKRVTL